MEWKHECAGGGAKRRWLRSSSCPEIDCVEVRFLADAVLMRDSKMRQNQLRFSLAEWGDFLRDLRSGPNPASAALVGTRIGSAVRRAAAKEADGTLAAAAAEGGG